MLKSSGAVAAATLLSRILGLFRDIAYGKLMGVELVASAFAYAYTIPNLFRRLLGEGVLTAAFIPHFKEKEKLEGEAEMWKTANAVLSALILVSGAVVLLMMGVASLLIASGWFKVRDTLMLDLLRVMSPYLVMVCIAAVSVGMLNSRGYFFIPALGSCMLNLAMIASVLWLAPRMGPTLDKQVFGVAIGVVIAGIAQALFQWPLLRKEGFRWRWVAPWKNESVRFVVRKMIPGTLGVAAFQINVLISQGLGWMVADHIVSSFGFAVRLMEFPQGLFGVSMATYLLPTLSNLATDKKYPEFKTTLRDGLGYVFFGNVVASILLVVLSEPIVRLLFERGKFDALATERVAEALRFLAPSLIAYSTVNILARAFYALGDTKTPTRISMACLLLNLFLTTLFVWSLQQAGMGLANSITSYTNALLLLFALRKKLARLEMSALKKSILIQGASGVCAAMVAWFGLRFWENQWGHGSFVLKAGAVFAPALAAGAIYVGIATMARCPYAREMVSTAFNKTAGRLAGRRA
ncbi:MAG: murein biosynthesis integral membrane protein MurJ [Verrucomicrobia bacterium]|nr:murein biosynthesis integral membrane protein MurJ [Verrucomicrobiota bacterium]